MFENIGGKIKNLATVITIIGFIICGISGLLLMINLNVLVGLLSGGLGCLMCWISSFLLYAVGDMAENLQEINHNMAVMCAKMTRSPIQNQNRPTVQSTQPNPINRGGPWVCKQCHQQNERTAAFCKNCGAYK